MALVTALQSPFRPTITNPTNTLTIGDGVVSYGDYNATDPGTLSADQAIAEAVKQLGYGGIIEILPGTFTFLAPVTVSVRGIAILCKSRATILKIAHTSQFGLFDFQAQDCSFTGGRVIVETWVNDQILFRILAADFLMDGTRVDVTTTAGTTANPMILVDIGNNSATSINDVTVKNMRIRPNFGVTCFRARVANVIRWEENRVGTNPSATYNTADGCFRVWDLVDVTHWTLESNRVYGLGFSALPNPPVGQPSSQTGLVDNVLHATDSTGSSQHGYVYDNYFEGIFTKLARSPFRIRAGRWVDFRGNKYGNFTTTLSDDVNVPVGIISIEGVTSYAVGTRQFGAAFTDERFHDCAAWSATTTLTGVCIQIGNCSNASIESCKFELLNSTAVRLEMNDGANLGIDRLSVKDNVFSSDDNTNAFNAIIFSTIGGGLQAARWGIDGNSSFGRTAKGLTALFSGTLPTATFGGRGIYTSATVGGGAVGAPKDDAAVAAMTTAAQIIAEVAKWDTNFVRNV